MTKTPHPSSEPSPRGPLSPPPLPPGGRRRVVVTSLAAALVGLAIPLLAPDDRALTVATVTVVVLAGIAGATGTPGEPRPRRVAAVLAAVASVVLSGCALFFIHAVTPRSDPAVIFGAAACLGLGAGVPIGISFSWTSPRADDL